jgi:AraC family transcriptional regulator, transcriptional activator of pobA
MASAALPLFHVDDDSPAGQASDFIHIDAIAARSVIHDWTIRAHRHRNLFQILLIERGGGEMTFQAAPISFEAPCAILVPASVVHGFRLRPAETDGWLITFSEDIAAGIGKEGAALAQLEALAVAPVVPLADGDREQLGKLAKQLHEEESLARGGFQVAMRGLLALITVEVARLAAARARSSADEVALEPAAATLDSLRKLIEEHFRKERRLAFYAAKLGLTIDRVNAHVRRAAGVTAGHLIRQRVLTEAKRELVFTNRAIHDIAADLAFSDQSHFARFFRKQTGAAPHEFRTARGG